MNERANLLNKDSEGAGEFPPTLDIFRLIEMYKLIPFALSPWYGYIGWLCKIKLSTPQEFETLLSEQAYKAHCEGESS